MNESILIDTELLPPYFESENYIQLIGMKVIPTKNAISTTKNLKEFPSNKFAALHSLNRKLLTKTLTATILKKSQMQTSGKNKA